MISISIIMMVVVFIISDVISSKYKI